MGGIARNTGHHLCTSNGLFTRIPIRKTTKSPSMLAVNSSMSILDIGSSHRRHATGNRSCHPTSMRRLDGRTSLDVLDGLRQLRERSFGVAIEHACAALEEQGILQSGEAATLAALEHDD